MDPTPSRTQIHQMAARWLAEGRRPEDLRIHTDTSDFFALDAGDVVVLDGRPYLVRNSIREGRFGLEDEVKHWVKRSVDLVSGAMRIIKLVFYERFTATIGGITFECFRSPRKEARILDLVAPLFQQFHPAVLQMLKATITAGHRRNVWVGMCGEMAGDPLATILLVGLGLDEFSVAPAALLEIKKIIRSIKASEARRIAERVLGMESEEEIRAFLIKQTRSFVADIPLES